MGEGVGRGGGQKVGGGWWEEAGWLGVAKWGWVRGEGHCELGVTVIEGNGMRRSGWWWGC